jgi:hypothetical protein
MSSIKALPGLREGPSEQGVFHDETHSISSVGVLVVSSGSPVSNPVSHPYQFVHLGDQTSRSGSDPATHRGRPAPEPRSVPPYEVTREYKVFRGDDRRQTSEVVAQIDFVPPDDKAYKIVQTSGNSWGAKIVRELLSSERSSTRKEHGTEISRANYDFVFSQTAEIPSHSRVRFAIFPKRKD